jgi:magnesium-transporting ATPase (P-type)
VDSALQHITRLTASSGASFVGCFVWTQGERYKVSINEADPAKSKGLTLEEAATRLNKEGKNMLTPPKAQNPFIQYLKLLKDPLTAMLLTAAILSLCSQAASTDDYSAVYLGAVLLFVVFLNTLVDFIQARKSEAMVKVRALCSCLLAYTTLLSYGTGLRLLRRRISLC